MKISYSHPTRLKKFYFKRISDLIQLSLYRRDIMKHLSMDMQNEMQFVENIILKLPKNYQVWHHRHVLVQWSQDPSRELHLTERVLEQDTKNYHAWQHRSWVITEFK